jgi:hypothetical protein
MSSSLASMMPALLNSTFSLPNAFSAASIICWQSRALRHRRDEDRVLDHRGGLCARFLVEIDDCDLRAFLGEQQRRLPADAAAAAGDEGYLVLESHMRSKYLLRSQSVTALS